jgi:hypothetical protein
MKVADMSDGLKDKKKRARRQPAMPVFRRAPEHRIH